MGGSGSGSGVLPALLNLEPGIKQQQQQFSWLLETPMIVSRSWPLTLNINILLMLSNFERKLSNYSNSKESK